MSVRRGFPLAITFPLIDSDARPLRKAGLIFDPAWVRVITPTSTATPTNTPTHLWNGRYTLALTAAEMDADWVHIAIEAPGCDPYDQLIGTSAHPSATANGVGTATSFETTLTETTSNTWTNNLITFTTGALAGQVRKVTAYNGTTKAITVDSAFTSAPALGDRFVLVNI